MRGAGGAAIRAQSARELARIVDGESLARLYLEWQSGDHSRDTALLRALVTGALRWHHRLDWQLGQLLERPLPAKDRVLAALLRIGLLQLQEMRIPDHAAVAETVSAASLIKRKHAKPLVNAVLRRFLRERGALERAMRDVPEALYSHPQWLIDAIFADWPSDALHILEANNTQAPLTLRINRTRTTVVSYRATLTAAGIDHITYEDAPFSVELTAPRPAAAIPGYPEGLVSIQDRAAQKAVEFLGLAPGQRVLDACAAPGGKTAHIREACPSLDELVALDIDADRLATLKANLVRLGLDATVLCADATRPEQWWDRRQFDRILLDAPCTAVGVIRRHPDIKLRRASSDLSALVARQRVLLERLWPLVRRPGGRLVYVTCSILRAETDRQVRAFVGEREDIVVTAEEQRLTGEANSDGFYYACLQYRE
jgi:16S rRNA (cytosine967-C5)-methyltransferase